MMTGGQETGKGGDARAQVVSAQAASAQRHVAASPAAVQTAPAKTPDGAVVGRRSEPGYVPTPGEETAHSAAPANKATTAFISRMFTTIFTVVCGQLPPVSAAHTSATGIRTAPTARSSRKRPAVSADNAVKSMAERERIYFTPF